MRSCCKGKWCGCVTSARRLGCDHGPWPDSAGWAAARSAHRKRNSIFNVPRDAVAFTCYGTPGRHFEHTTSGLVLKSVLAGREEFAVDGGVHCVTEGEVLVMNGGRRYGSLAVSEQAAMHTYCVEFGEAFVA